MKRNILLILTVVFLCATATEKTFAQSALVRDAQGRLNAAGYDAGPIDGFDGPKTRAAVSAFHQANGIPATGRLDERTMKLLSGTEADVPVRRKPDTRQLVPDPDRQPPLRKSSRRIGPRDATEDIGGVAAPDPADADVPGPPRLVQRVHDERAAGTAPGGMTIVFTLALLGSMLPDALMFRRFILRRRIAALYSSLEQDLLTLGTSIERLANSDRYPSACLLNPLVERAGFVARAFPRIIPDGSLPAMQLELVRKVVGFAGNPEAARRAAVETFVAGEIEAMREFFDGIEANPLTPEQRRAVVTDEDATLVLAGAGSGKTSVIVAKAAYLIERGIRKPDETLLMAFGKDAAAEMADRIEKRCGAAVDAMTFHALGNSIIRQVEGGAPAVAAHASDDVKSRALLREILMDDVAKKAGMGGVLVNWFSKLNLPYRSAWDFKTLAQYYAWVEAHDLRTLGGDRVKSFEELEIANWLYSNGIEYEYEPVYEHDLPAGAYRPDFRLTRSGVYIEHFGVRKSKAPDGSARLVTAPHVDRDKYLEQMDWKRNVHRENGTILIETFSYERVEGRLLKSLEEKLAPHVETKPVPEDQLLDKLAEIGQVDRFT